jgi:hypothetical protein
MLNNKMLSAARRKYVRIYMGIICVSYDEDPGAMSVYKLQAITLHV